MEQRDCMRQMLRVEMRQGGRSVLVIARLLEHSVKSALLNSSLSKENTMHHVQTFG